MGRLFLAFLAVAWACVLIPAGLRRRPERGSFSLLGLGESMAGLASRRRSRNSLGRNSAPIWSVGDGYNGGPVPPISRSWGESVGRPTGRPAASGRALPGPVPFGRPMRRNVRRQRQIVIALVSTVLVSLLLSFVPGLRVLLLLTMTAAVLLAVYVVALLRLKAGIAPSRARLDGADPFWGSARGGAGAGSMRSAYDDDRLYPRAVGE